MHSSPLQLTINGTCVVLEPIPAGAVSRSAEAVQRQRKAARDALALCAKESNAPTTGWTQHPDGAPIPNGGWYWSVSHKRQWAGAVISREPIGLDIEVIQPRQFELYDKVGSDREWNLLGGRTWNSFFSLWTAKEATLKANGVGIGMMSECVVVEVADNATGSLLMKFRQRMWRVEYTDFDEHIVAVSRPA